MAFSSFCKQMLQEACKDSGHLHFRSGSHWRMSSTGGLLQHLQADIHPYVACLDHATSNSTHRSQQKEPCGTGHSSTGGAYAGVRVKEAVVLQSLWSHRIGLLRRTTLHH